MAKRSRYARFEERQPYEGNLVMVKLNEGRPKLAKVMRDRNGYYWLFENGKEVMAIPNDRWKPVDD